MSKYDDNTNMVIRLLSKMLNIELLYNHKPGILKTTNSAVPKIICEGYKSSTFTNS